MAKKGQGRKEVFEIAEDEQLIGCEIDEGKKMLSDFSYNYFLGITWMKMKVFAFETRV